jgi:hypothetical protein
MEDVDLTLILRNTRKALCDAEAAFAAAGLGAVENGWDGVARSSRRAEQTLGGIFAKLSL